MARLPTGLLVQQGSGYLSPRTFLCCTENGEGGSEDLHFYIIAGRGVAEAVQQGALACPALWVDSSAVEAGSGMLQVVYRLGGAPVVRCLPFKPIKLQPVKQAAAGSVQATFRAFVASATYTQAYRIAAGLLPKLGALHAHLASSGIPVGGLLPPSGEKYSPEGLRAMPLHEGLLLERFDAATGQLSKLKISINFHNACLELHDAVPDASTVNKCLRTINSLAEAVVALEGRPGEAPLAASPIKAARRGAPVQSPAKPPLPSGLDSVRHGIALIQSCAAAQLREGVALLSAAAGSPQLAASAVIMGALEALVSAAASVLPSPVMGMAELHMLLSTALSQLLDSAPPSAHAPARTVTVVGAVLQKNCANPVLLCKVLATLLQRPGVRLAAIHQQLASAISAAYVRLVPALEAEAQLLLAAVQDEGASGTVPGQAAPEQQQQQQAAGTGSEQPTAVLPAATTPTQPMPQAAAFGSPQVLLVEAPAARQQRMGAKQGLGIAAKPLATLPAVRTKPAGAAGTGAAAAAAVAAGPAVPFGKSGYVAHMVSTFNALKVDTASPAGSPTKAGSGGLARLDSGSAWSPPKASSPARSVSAMSNASLSRVPRLLLPGAESPTGSAGGLTRSTRRAMGSPIGRRSPSPTRFGSPVRNSEEAVEQSASVQLAALASALGEALMAADLPAIIAHKRRANAAGGSAGDEVPSELLQPPTPGVRKSLEAHKVFVTAKSLRSLESTLTRTTDTGATQGGGSARQAAEMEELKCLLLETLVASLPVVGSLGYPDRDPSPVLAMEVLCLLGQSPTSQQEQLMRLCLRALRQLSQPAAAVSDAQPHILLTLAAAKLSQLVPQLGAQGPPAAQGAAADLLQLMTEYVGSVQSSSVAVAAAQHCSTVVQSLVGVLLAAGMDPAEWAAGPWRLLHRLSGLLAAVCAKCHDAKPGRMLLRILVADQQTVAMLMSAASLALLHPELAGSPAFPYRSGVAMLQRTLLQLLIELAGLVGRQPVAQAPAPCGGPEPRAVSRLSSLSSLGWDEGMSPTTPAPTPAADLLLAPGPKGGKRLTRSQAFQLLWPFISPHSGFVRRILDHEPCTKSNSAVPATPATPASADSVRLRHDVLQLLRVAFSAQGNPFVLDKATTDFFIQFHFVQFLKLYHNPQRDHQALALCKKHMEVLLALASHKAPHARKRFQQLSMMDFFVREVSLEFECSEPTAARARVSRSGSTEPRRRSSSFSMDGDTTRRLSDRSAGNRSVREGSLPPPALSLGKSDTSSAVTPPPVPALRLAFKPAESTFSLQQAAPVAQQAQQQQQQQQQQQGGPPGGRPALGLAIPRLNLPGTPPLGSPSEGVSPSAPSSARLGRPPLPPSARTARMGTPRTSRLGRPAGEGFNPSPNLPGVAEASTKLAKSPFFISVHASSLPPAPDANQGSGRMAVPKLGLGRVGLSLALPKAPLASPGSERSNPQGAPQQPSSRAPSSRGPSSMGDPDSDDSSDEEEAGVSSSRGASARQQGAPPGLGLQVPAGFVWSGDLDEDVARLEALEEQLLEDGNDDEAASPTIPALRPFDPESADSPPVPSLLGMVPRLALPGKASPLAVSTASPAAAAPSAPDGGRPSMAIPRLNLNGSMHSNLETRTASAELQVALDAERAKRKVGRTFLGDLEKNALGKGKMQAVSLSSKNFLTERDGAVSLEVSYEEERSKRLLYRDETLHLQVLQLIFMLLSAADGQLDPAYIDQLPWQRKMLNIPHILHHHFNHPDTRPLLARLLPLLHSMGPAAMRLLRVLCGGFFRPDWYSGSRMWIGKGAYAQVYRYQLPEWTGEGTVVFKVLDLPKHFEDHCRQVDFFNEVSIMETLAPSPRAVQLLDYGIDAAADTMFLVMRDYRCSLRKWREAQPADPRGQLRLYLAIFQQLLSAVKSLMEVNVLHFDLKCDNVLLEPLPGVGEAEFWAPSDAAPPFRVVLADFGESKLFTGSLDGAMTVRNRGTECAKSPEMLLAANAYKKDARTYDRRRREGAGAASDVWSLGCLLYELIAGQFLFSVEPDWVRFFVHITDPRSGQLITPDKAQAVQHLPGVMGLLQFILVRDARLRPTLHDVQARLEALLHGSRVRLPSYVRPAAHADAIAAGGGLPSSHRPLQSPTMLHSPKLAAPLPLAAPLLFAPGLLVAPLAAAQSAQSLQRAVQQRHVGRVVLLVGSIAPLAPDCAAEPVSARSSRTARALAPIGNTLEAGACSTAPSSSGVPSCSDDASPASSPLKSGRRWGSFSSSAAAAPVAQQQQQEEEGGPAGHQPLSPAQQFGSSAAASRLGTPRGLAEHSVATVAAAEGGRRLARPLFNSARVHAASATYVPSVFEAARGPELGGCSEWPGSSGSTPRRSPSGGEAGRPAPRRAGSGTPPASPRGPYQPLLPAGFAEERGMVRSPAEDPAYATLLSNPELAECGAACAAVGVECQVVPCSTGSGSSGALGGSPLKPVAPMHAWLRMALPALEAPLASGHATTQLAALDPEAVCPAVLLAVAPGCEGDMAALAVAHLMAARRLGLYQAMVHAAQWGLDLHLGEPQLRALQRWAEGLL